MRKILAGIFLIWITACVYFNQSDEVWISNTQNEKLYVKVDGLENIPHHKLVFMQHGLASNMEHQAIQAAKRAFLDNGYVVVTFDSRYSLGNGDNDVEKVRFSTFEDDLKTVTAWAQTQPFYSEPFALVGHSLGGGAVLQYSAEHPQKVAVLVPITPVISGNLWEKSCMTNLAAFCRQWQKNKTYKYTDAKNHKTAVIPFDVVTSSKAYDAYKLAAKIKAKTLLIAAADDIIIAPNDVQTLAGLMDGQAQAVVVANSGHNFEEKQNQKDLYNDINTFLQ